MFTVNSDQKVPRWDQVVQIPFPFILILCCLTRMSNETSRGTTKKLKPAICVPMAVFTSDSDDKAVPFALEVHWFVIVVDKMVFPYAIFSFVGDWTVSTCKRKDAIFLASSVPTVPFSQRETFFAVNCGEVVLPIIYPYDTTYRWSGRFTSAPSRPPRSRLSEGNKKYISGHQQ